jgi:hypothetical protein
MNPMKRILWVCVFALPFVAVPSRAQAWGWCVPPLEVDAGFNCRFNVHALDWSTIAKTGPWYLYFPYDAHFQTAAPVHPYPHWPGPMVLPPPPGVHPGPGPAAPVQVGPALPSPVSYYHYQPTSVFQQVGYFYPTGPAYWYYSH